eukprot:CAMPEP_0198233650 /NCGR_PEP_ID=MMETSP1445-20131203/116348_1 /TAXON_ID=36898 /ORGANISM="Pyramimonas sp., Strain CCMP2087" /LENGTH=96 /DNA_ID=CAMNT_0043914349 /DNA_START=862 /DNA_END=1152 /DNA_ORIENTATION=+
MVVCEGDETSTGPPVFTPWTASTSASSKYRVRIDNRLGMESGVCAILALTSATAVGPASSAAKGSTNRALSPRSDSTARHAAIFSALYDTTPDKPS